MMAELITLSEINNGFNEKSKEIITRSYELAKKAHNGQKRFSGEDYFNHVLRVVQNLLELGVGESVIVAGFLHDVVEDCGVNISVIEEDFGKDVASLVLGVTKLGGLKYRGRGQYAENLKHLFMSMAKDVRVILIKLCDRLDNIRTIEYVPKEKQERIALETIEIYASIANRLGMGKMKSELEDKSFPYAFPKEYLRTKHLIQERGGERKKYIEKVYKSLIKEIAKEEILDAKVSYRTKDKFSIYKKLLKTEMDVAKIYDIYALRIIAPTLSDCYKILGIIHNMWKPLPGRIKDYIANPKTNGYQSLHTTVFTGDGGIAEIQIRTKEMHHEAEYGIAAHLMYKDDKSGMGDTKERLKWLSEIKLLHQDSDGSSKFLRNLKFDLFESRIFTFTPMGDVIELPSRASVLDFAYAIHSDIGDHTAGARVNGKYVSINKQLSNADIVEIDINKKNHPTYKWLLYAKTSFARRHIRSYLSKN